MAPQGGPNTRGGRATGRPADGEPKGQPQRRRARGPRYPADAPEQQSLEEPDEPAGSTATPVEDVLEAELADQPAPSAAAPAPTAASTPPAGPQPLPDDSRSQRQAMMRTVAQLDEAINKLMADGKVAEGARLMPIKLDALKTLVRRFH